MIEKYIVWALPVLLTALLASVITRKQKDKERFNLACDAFRSVFDVAIHALETIPFCDRDILNNNFRTHEKATIKFRDNLKGKKLDSFNIDWKQYEQYCLSRVDVPLLCFIGKERSSINGPDDSSELDLKHRQKALKHIRKLLSYTKK